MQAPKVLYLLKNFFRVMWWSSRPAQQYAVPVRRGRIKHVVDLIADLWWEPRVILENSYEWQIATESLLANTHMRQRTANSSGCEVGVSSTVSQLHGSLELFQ
mmetsp:Transcript_14756/g.31631  ORF Transcript_14756/g.31631 Transcript_14756/m.31631 type:complete len:103 (-) Transcript_14756:179-487(-)